MPQAKRPVSQTRRPTPLLIDRRRRDGRRRIIIALTVILIVVVGVSAVAAAGGKSDKPLDQSEHASSSRSGTAHRGAGRGGSHSATHAPAKSTGVTNPIKSTAVTSWIHARQGNVSIAVDDLKTGQEWLWNPTARDQTASIIKADILETVLYQNEQAGRPLADAETDTAEDMIEESSDTAATELWDQIGEAAGIAAYNAKAGLTQTTPHGGGFWGETLTSAADQIKVLEQLALKPKLLTTAARNYELSLMHNIDAGQNWGVTGGVPRGVSVALKNGWVPLTSYTNWEINSIGWVNGKGHDYLIAVLTAHDPSEQYGIDTIERISAGIYKALDPK